ncbi:MAG: hypothetical protein R3B68_16085 [Phycisphaerales bacterium]
MLFELVQLGTMPPVAPAPVPVDGQAVAHGVSTLPLGLHAPAVVGLIAGLLLWVLGGRIVKFAMAVLGLAGGAGLGSVLAPTIGVTAIAGFPGHLVGMAIGGIVGLVAAVLLFRFAMVIAGAGVIGAAAALGGLVYVNVAPPPSDMQTPEGLAPIVEWAPDGGEAGAEGENAESAEDTLEQAMRDIAEQEARRSAEDAADQTEQGLRSLVSEETAGAVEEAADRVRAFVHDVWRSFVRQWNALDAAQRVVLAGFVIVGLAGGALIGLAMPHRSAAMLTSLAGSAIWLASLAWLGEAMELPGRQWLTSGDHASLKWLIAWPVVAIIGMVFQFRNLRKPADEAAPRSRASRSGRDDDDRD